MGRLFWIIQVGPVESEGPLNVKEGEEEETTVVYVRKN